MLVPAIQVAELMDCFQLSVAGGDSGCVVFFSGCKKVENICLFQTDLQNKGAELTSSVKQYVFYRRANSA